MNSFDRTLRDFRHGKSHSQRQLSRQIETLQNDLEKLSRRARRSGEDHLDDWSNDAAEIAEQVSKQVQVAGREVQRYAEKTGRAIQRDPVPILVAAGTIALVAGILLSRR